MIRGEIWWVDFGIPFGSEPAFRRPSIIVQSDSFNQTEMHTTIVIPLTSNLRLADFPGNMQLPASETGLSKDSVAVTPQITVIDKSRLLEKVSELNSDTMSECAENIRLLLDI
ncbi:MAG: type II toxin-antitoxin system PemK/MazF family toxin [Treponema sp.]|nr:type II toxin-antitoxin system PemK/MazF family toxin [Treponema sp.]